MLLAMLAGMAISKMTAINTVAAIEIFFQLVLQYAINFVSQAGFSFFFRECPQLAQNLAPSASGDLHFGQMFCAIAFPQFGQKLPSNSVPQFGQRLIFFLLCNAFFAVITKPIASKKEKARAFTEED